MGNLFKVLRMCVGCASVQVHFYYLSLYVCAGGFFPVLPLLPTLGEAGGSTYLHSQTGPDPKSAHGMVIRDPPPTFWAHKTGMSFFDQIWQIS